MAHDWAHGTLRSICNVWVRVNLAPVVLQPCVGDRADIRARVGGRVVGWEDGGDGAYDWTDGLVHGFVLGGVDGFFEGGAGFGAEVGVGGDSRVFVQGVMVVCGCFSDWADQAWRVHVEVWVRGRQDGVGRADNGADLLRDGGHDAVVVEDERKDDGSDSGREGGQQKIR